MKKFAAIVLAVFMIATQLVGCSGNSGSSIPASDAAGSANTAAPSKLTLVLRAGSYTDVMKALAPQFEKENNCTIEILDLDLSDMYQKIALDSKNSTGAYDVVMVDGSWFTEFLTSGVLMDLTSMGYSLDSDFIEGSTKGGLDENGNVYCVPFFGNVQLFYYNKDVLKKNGYDAPPTDWESVLELAKKVNATGTYGFLARAQAGENIVTDVDPLLLSAGGQILDDDDKVTINTPEYKKALDLYIQLIKAGKIMAKDDIVAAVNNGSAAMSLIWPGWYTPGGDDSTSFALMPNKIGPNDPEYDSAWYGLWYLGVTANSQNKDLALKFIQYATSAESEIATVQYGLTPIRHSPYKDASVLKQSPQLAVVYEALQKGVYRPAVPQWTEITNTLGTELDNAVQGAKSVDEALADAQSACEEVMSR